MTDAVDEQGTEKELVMKESEEKPEQTDVTEELGSREIYFELVTSQRLPGYLLQNNTPNTASVSGICE